MRVSQIVKAVGIDAEPIYRARLSAEADHRRQTAHEAAERRCRQRWDLSLADRKALLKAGRNYVANGRTWCTTPIGAYRQQRQNARRRGVAWQLTLGEWWHLWEPFWATRGRRRNQLVLCQRGDRGPYAIGNVFIQSASRNCSDARRAVTSQAPA